MVMPQPIMLSSSRATHFSRPTTLALVHMESRVSAVTVSGSSPLDLHTSMMACEEGVGEREIANRDGEGEEQTATRGARGQSRARTCSIASGRRVGGVEKLK